MRGNYDHVKCPVCGIPWEEHSEECPRHAFRPTEAAPLVVVRLNGKPVEGKS